ncbi:MAG: hypothetical protein IK120_08455 [Muribaculaceae bacterium]|nr:hypothetical protein [Muribaculaceae bacterium]
MKQNKEYPATHSMNTSWFCADEDGNVGIIDIEEDGPVPVGEYAERCFNDVFWDIFSNDNEGLIKNFKLTPEQIVTMLEPYDNRGEWEQISYGCNKYGFNNIAWSEVVIKIDMSKLDVLVEALKPKNKTIVCLSRALGLFFVDFFSDKDVVELLERNKVVLKKFRAPDYGKIIYNDNVPIMMNPESKKFPVFIFYQDYCPSKAPAIRLTNPPHPLKIEQLPDELQKKIKIIPIKFKDKEQIQLAELMPVCCIWSPKFVYNGMIWWLLASSDNSFIYYNESSNTIISKEHMDEFMARGEAEAWDYHKHNDNKLKY